MGYIHLAPKQRFNPYLYIGAGGMVASVKNFAGTELKGSGFGLLIPAGVGFDAFINRDLAFTMNAGYRMLDGKLDLIDKGSMNGALTANVGLTFFFGDSETEDEDKDGLSLAQERRFGTNPKNPDTDGDGILDGDELRKFRTNPLRMDTDGDGLSDGDEVGKYRTDPAKFDTDGDLLSDGDEVLKHKTDPLKADSDGDGLSDGDEVIKYKTNPLRVDSDGDGLSDQDEALSTKSDPNNPDSDADGLLDGDEVKKYKTDPVKADTDRGGMNDGGEVKGGTNPLDPADDKPGAIQLQRGRSVILDGVNFGSGSAMLIKGSETVLEKAYVALLAQPGLTVEIAGYTDDVGVASQNELLSLRRAEAVKSWLVKKGIPSWRLTTVGKGPREPLAPNDSPEGRAKNRRIEFHVK
jgi:outer membrane protein OmpA-like peptidoglycan-associated protein